MKQQPTVEYLRECFDYDPVTGDLWWNVRPRYQFKTAAAWKLCKVRDAGKLAGGVRQGYRRIKLDEGMYLAHRIAFALSYGRWPKNDIDHINGDGTDNRLCNLRSVTRKTNAKNQKKRRTNRSGVMGVCWNVANSNWVAYISTKLGRKHIGSFAALEDAVAARKRSETKHGYHANHGRVA